MIVVTGADGQLGNALRNLLGAQATYLSRRELDLELLETIGPIIARLRPTLIVNCAAYTNVDQAEEEPSRALLINATAVGALAKAAAKAGADFVTYSTDYVFNGRSSEPYTENSTPSPLNTYGASKLAGERSALAEHPGALVIRTSWLLSGTHHDFVSRILEGAHRGPLQVVDDERGHPTIVDDLAAATWQAISRGAKGLLHLANAGVLSRYGLARECLQLAGMDPQLISRCSSQDQPKPARRPANAVLESQRLGGLGLQPLPHYRDGLRRIVARLS